MSMIWKLCVCIVFWGRLCFYDVFIFWFVFFFVVVFFVVVGIFFLVLNFLNYGLNLMLERGICLGILDSILMIRIWYFLDILGLVGNIIFCWICFSNFLWLELLNGSFLYSMVKSIMFIFYMLVKNGLYGVFFRIFGGVYV